MEEFEEHFSDFVSHMQISAYRNSKKVNVEYQEIQNYLNKREEKFKEIINSLDEDDKEFIWDYIDKQSCEATCLYDNLYISGYRDCIRLLKEIGII
ncbi:hypothetical protein [Vallitalea guaymasensis]|uniref:hypothetical protein n=1 Tax=Vallitalea guaymasensis TaxID=1185412 RepID=UPI00272CD96C|nr:hypothetical protein [Vallitalea guaymasensis]